MSSVRSDALVFFGATGDLAYKKIFPALQAMIKRDNLDIPVIGVANAGWNVDQLRARAKDSLEKRGGLDPQAFEKLSGLLRYVDGDYKDPATFQKLRRELKDARQPTHYLAIPLSSSKQLCSSWSSRVAATVRGLCWRSRLGETWLLRKSSIRCCCTRSKKLTYTASTTILERNPSTICWSFALPTLSWRLSGTGTSSRVSR